MKNKKNAFTLIELLAVIIILGILMIIAIPSVTSYINNSRKSAYVDTAREIILGARNLVNNGKLEMFDTNTTYYIPASCVSTETGFKSPFGDFSKAYVGVIYNGSGYDYYWISNDITGHGIKKLTLYEKLDTNLIETDIKDTEIEEIVDKMSIDGRKNITILNDDCSDWEEVKEAVSVLNSDGTIENIGATFYKMLMENAISDNKKSTYVSSNTGINFNEKSSNTNGKGLYIRANTLNDTYPILYYRGTIDNNNLYFANYCWKIVRTTETGGIKLIYNGFGTKNGDKRICNSTGSATQIGTASFNNNNTLNDPVADLLTGVGYMYGSTYPVNNDAPQNYLYFGTNFTYSNGTYTLINPIRYYSEDHHYACFSNSYSPTCTSIRYYYYYDSATKLYITLYGGMGVEQAVENMYLNVKDSNIKKRIDNWYSTILKSFTNKLEDTIWCNNRKIINMGGWDPTGLSLQDNYYGDKLKYQNNDISSFQCPNINDSFGVDVGNKKLKYPVGLLTWTEHTLAGAVSDRNNDYYLSNGLDYWTMTPIDEDNLYYSDSTGRIHAAYGFPGYSYGIRPVISLKHGVDYVSGSGTINDPYIVE